MNQQLCEQTTELADRQTDIWRTNLPAKWTTYELRTNKPANQQTDEPTNCLTDEPSNKRMKEPIEYPFSLIYRFIPSHKMSSYV